MNFTKETIDLSGLDDNQIKNKLSSSIAIIIALVFLMNNNLLKAISLDSGDRYSHFFERKNLMIEVCNEFLFNI